MKTRCYGVVAALSVVLSAWSAPRISSAQDAVPKLVSARAAKAPKLDGKLDDPVWKSATPLTVTAKRVLPPNVGQAVEITLRCVHTDSEIFIAATWSDANESVSHKTWVWNAEKKLYETGPDREDMFAVVFGHTGEFNPDMLSGVEAVWDVWHWKAFRTNPQGFAMDKTHRYTAAKPEGKAKSYEAKNGKTIWIARPEDNGETVEKGIAAPTENKGQRVAAYAAGVPSGSAADVRAKGAWADGKWTLEMGRKLTTGHSDDTAFDPAKSYLIGVAAFDQTGDMDKASGAIRLSFASTSVSYHFDSDNAGKTPAGFTEALTAGGGPVKWQVIEATGAPSGKQVVAQLSQESTNVRYPLLVGDTFSARDVDVSVRFKPISGKVDQAAGIVWRFQDKDNYFVVRANALENNVVAYKTVAGKRSSIGIKGDEKAYGVKATVAPNQWSMLRVRMVGNLAEVFLSDHKLFEVQNDTFPGPGKVGLWTKADSVTYFDDLNITSLDKS